MKRTWKLLKIILLFLLVIGILISVGLYYASQKLEKIKNSIEPETLSQINSLISKEEQKNLEHKEFVTPDGKLKLKYLSNWREIKDPATLEKNLPKEIKENYGLEILFLARRLTGKGLSQLEICKGTLEAESVKEFIEATKALYQKEGWEMEIIDSSKPKDNEYIFEIRYSKPNRHSFRSKEKIVFLEDTAYIVTFFTAERDWNNFLKESNEIMDSVEIID